MVASGAAGAGPTFAGKFICLRSRPNGKVSNMTFGGPNGDVLYVTVGDKGFKRQLKVKGADHATKPIRPGAPQL